MTDDQHEGHLGAVYRATKPEEIAELYDAWAETYDAGMIASGYRHPTICLALVARYLPKGAAPLLDAGAGTGQMGEWLALAGYPHVEALDISEGMLAVAARKGVYRAFHRIALGGTLPFADDSFSGVVSTGVFTTGHVGAEGLDELVRVCAPGGVLVLTVKMTVWDGGFSARVDALADRVSVVEQTAPYVSMPGEVGTVPAIAVVLRRR